MDESSNTKEESTVPRVEEDDRTSFSQLAPLHITTPVKIIEQKQESHWETSHRMQYQCIYLVILLVALGMVMQPQDEDGSSWTMIAHHDPSIRIFRTLSEMGLLLLCTSGCVYVWCRYLGVAETERLLFYPPHSQHGTHPGGEDEEEEENDFDNVHEDNVFGEYHQDPSSGTARESVVTISVSHVPSPMVLFSAALDLFLWILLAFFCYALAASKAVAASRWRWISQIAAPTFPLLLFVYAAFKMVTPFRKRATVFQVLSFTLWAPSFSVSFRDGMIGDILTSTVRPLQDIAFTTCYILFGLRGWWSASYFDFVHAADASVPAMEKSWFVHTLILPACMISPLWYRFLQNMRQVHDEKQRWPYLGNAWKYFMAAQVAMVGVYHPHVKQNPVWLLCFALATLYQIWWDVVMDWGLLVKGNNGWKLRDHRLYPGQTVYWSLTLINALLRFCWTLNFVPTRYLSAAGLLIHNGVVAAPVLASAEIVRRSLWALLRVEWESVKDASSSSLQQESSMQDMMPMTMGKPKARFFGDMKSMGNAGILGELCLYTSTFALLGLIIAAHRGTM